MRVAGRIKWIVAAAFVVIAAWLILTPTFRYFETRRLLADGPEQGIRVVQQPLWPDWFWRPIAGEWAQPLSPITEVTVWKERSFPRIDDQWPERIAAISTMKELDVSRGGFTEEEALRLIEAEPQDLEVLYFNRSDIGDETLRALVELESLQRLHISETLVTEDGINRLRSMRPEMKIIADPMTRRGLGNLRRRVRPDLNASRCIVWGLTLPYDVTVEEATSLARLPNPIWVVVRAPLRPEILDAVAELPNLRRLELPGYDLTQWLRKGDTDFSPEVFDRFAHSRSLEELTLNHAPLTDDHVPHIAAIASLRAIDLAGSGVTGEGIEALHQLRPDIEIRSLIATREEWYGSRMAQFVIDPQPRWRGPTPQRIPLRATTER